jgi:hypothetical protein
MMLRSETGIGLRKGKGLVKQSCGHLLENLEGESVSVNARCVHRQYGEIYALPILAQGKHFWHIEVLDLCITGCRGEIDC